MQKASESNGTSIIVAVLFSLFVLADILLLALGAYYDNEVILIIGGMYSSGLLYAIAGLIYGPGKRLESILGMLIATLAFVVCVVFAVNIIFL